MLFVGVAGWEACATLTDAVHRPGRTLPRVTAATLLVIGTVYLSLAVTTIGTLGPAAAQTGVPLYAVVHTALGPAGRPVVAAIALVLTVGAANTYLAGAARSGATLAAAGDLPAWLAHQPRGIARRSLTVQAIAAAAMTAAAMYWHIPPGHLMRLVTVLLAAVALAGMTAAVLLLPAGWHTAAALTGTAVTAAVLGSAGPKLLIPVTIAGAALLWRAASRPITPVPAPAARAAAPTVPGRRPRMHLPATMARTPAASTVSRPGRQPPNAPAPVRRKRRRRRRKRAARQRRRPTTTRSPRTIPNGVPARCACCSSSPRSTASANAPGAPCAPPGTT